MDNFIKSLSVVLPILLMLGVGVVCKKKNAMSENSVSDIKKLVVNIMLPAILLNAFFTAEYSVDVIVVALLMFAVCTALLFVFRMFKKQPLLQFVMTGFEAGMLGYALFSILFANVPTADISYFAILDIGQVLFVFTLYNIMITKNESKTLKQEVLKIAKSPVIIAIVVGIVVGASGLFKLLSNSNISSGISSVLSFISAPTACLVLICVGFELDFNKSSIKQATAYSILRLVVMACVGIAFYYALSIFNIDNGKYLYPILLMFLLPPPYVLPIMQKYEDARKLSSTTLSIYTVLFIVIFVVLALVIA